MIPDPKQTSGVLTFVIRDDAPMIHCNDTPTFRTVTIYMTDEQKACVQLHCTAMTGSNASYEQVSRVILEPEGKAK